jgi:hypothetical protein
MQVPDLNLEDPEFDEKRRQWQTVKAFFEAMKGKDGSLTVGVNLYQTPNEFRRQFEQHLRDRLTAVLEACQPREPKPSALPAAEAKDLVRWTRAPYPGLEAFKPDQHPFSSGGVPRSTACWKFCGITPLVSLPWWVHPAPASRRWWRPGSFRG